MFDDRSTGPCLPLEYSLVGTGRIAKSARSQLRRAGPNAHNRCVVDLPGTPVLGLVQYEPLDRFGETLVVVGGRDSPGRTLHLHVGVAHGDAQP